MSIKVKVKVEHLLSAPLQASPTAEEYIYTVQHVEKVPGLQWPVMSVIPFAN